MKRSGIYAIWNSLTGKIYIGQAIHILKRWKNHKIELRLNRHRNVYLQSAYNKYGAVNMVFYVVEYCAVKDLDRLEQEWMDFYNSSDRECGYNLSPTAGGSCLGFKHSEETRALLSAKRKNKPRSEEAKAAIKAGWLKRKAKGGVSEETKRKQSEVHKNKKPSLETKALMSKSRIGNQNAVGSKRSSSHIEALTEGRRKARLKDFVVTNMISVDS